MGPAGVSAYQVVEQTTAVNSVSPKSLTVACPAGTTVFGGGAVMNNSGADVSAYYSYPSGDAWSAGFTEDTATATPWFGWVYAICARVT